jgi:hypothetical protein
MIEGGLTAFEYAADKFLRGNDFPLYRKCRDLGLFETFDTVGVRYFRSIQQHPELLTAGSEGK